MITDCRNVVPGEPLSYWQAQGLRLVSLFQGRDVVLAFDLTGSVNFDEQGKIRLRQIIEDSLQKGDRVYIVPFASEVNPLNDSQIGFDNYIQFSGKLEEIEKILSLFPVSSSQLQNTDIQNAELEIYQGLAQENQCRLSDGSPVKAQSVVWITDAPLFTESGIPSSVWVETPANSPFRQKNSPESRQREQWLNHLPLSSNSQTITTSANDVYNLTVVDIEPTVQEFCTPAPGGRQICSVNSYLFSQLWLPTLGVIAFCLLGLGFLTKWLTLQKKWTLEVRSEGSVEITRPMTFSIKNGEKIYLGGNSGRRISLESEQVGYLVRKGNKLKLRASSQGNLFYNNTRVGRSEEVDTSTTFRVKSPDSQGSDFNIQVRVKK